MAVLVDPNDPSRTILVGNLFPEREKQELIEFLKHNLTFLPGLMKTWLEWIQSSQCTD